MTEIDKIIICVYINDLRQGDNPEHMKTEMKNIIDEIPYMRPKCCIYICSILPADSTDISKHKIEFANSQLEDLQRYSEKCTI